MKVLYLIRSLGGGGAEKVMSALINYNTMRYEQKLITYSPIKVHEVQTVHEVLDCSAKNDVLSVLKNQVIRFFKVRKEKKSYDVCVSFMELPNIMNIVTAVKCKTIISVRSLTSENIKSLSRFRCFVVKKLLKWTYPRADRVVAVSKAVKDDLIKFFGVSADKIEVIHNPIDFNKIEQLKHESLSEKEESIFSAKTIVHCGRFTEAKGHWYLLKIFKIVTMSKPNVNLVLLGDGELRADIEQLVEMLDLKKRVFIMGFKQNPYKYLHRGDIFLYTSLWEGFPNAVLEAMACSNAIISSDCQSGIAEILLSEDENIPLDGVLEARYGILTPKIGRRIDFSDSISKDEQLVADKVVELLNDDVKLDQRKIDAYKRAERFKIEKIMELWNNAIERV